LARGLPKSYIKKYGITKKAWAEYRKAHKKRKTRTSKSKSKRKSGGKRMAKKKRRTGGKKFFGNIGLKGLIVGGALLAGAKYLVARFLPQAGAYSSPIAAIGAGAVGSVVGSGKSLMTFGLIDGVSELIVDLVTAGGLVNLPTIGTQTRGYNLG